MSLEGGPWEWRSLDCSVRGIVRVTRNGRLQVDSRGSATGEVIPEDALEMARAIIAANGSYRLVETSDLGELQELVERLGEEKEC